MVQLRDDFRHFRADRILDQSMLDEGFPISGKTLFARWQGRFGFEDKTSTQPRSAGAYKHPPGTVAYEVDVSPAPVAKHAEIEVLKRR